MVLVLDPMAPGDAGSRTAPYRTNAVTYRVAWVGSIPRSQAYYWTTTWQDGERETVRAYERGEGIRFSSGREAAAWLLADDEDDQASDGA